MLKFENDFKFGKVISFEQKVQRVKL